MVERAATLREARVVYSGLITRPERWASYTPRRGDILVSTPAKSGTTWTQSILAMLVHGGTDLPRPLPVLSPWVDADLGIPEAQVRADLDGQSGRRVVKTHTPLDGVAVWDGVPVITVYRHPLDVFFSLRKHYQNMTCVPEGVPILKALPVALDDFLRAPVDPADYSNRSLAAVVLHYLRTRESARDPAPAMFHYADMVADHRGAVARLAKAAGIAADAGLIDRVTEATAFSAMQAQAAAFAPAGGSGFFRSDADFFARGGTGRWHGKVPPEALALFEARLAELVPDASARAWLLGGSAASGG